MGNYESSVLRGPVRIVVIAPLNGNRVDCLSELVRLPKDAVILATAPDYDTLNLLDSEERWNEGNIILNISGTIKELGPIIRDMPFLRWVHNLTAGVDHMLCYELVSDPSIVLTNAKGLFSSSLAEYVMCSCSYFSKNIYRLMKNKDEKQWDRFNVEELRDKTMGIVGYGSIGQACAKLAKAYGMKVWGLRRSPDKSRDDVNVDRIFDNSGLNYLMRECDFVVIALALTSETYHFINKSHFAIAKKNLVIINIARGDVINEDDLIDALVSNSIRGAALDVFSVEPLPADSPLWTLPNVLISPHNADMTADFRHKSVRLFCKNVAKFIVNDVDELDNKVDVSLGY